MSSTSYPQVGANAFAQGCEAARRAITAFFTALTTRLGLNPDERGLTDQLLYHLTDRVPVHVVCTTNFGIAALECLTLTAIPQEPK